MGSVAAMGGAGLAGTAAAVADLAVAGEAVTGVAGVGLATAGLAGVGGDDVLAVGGTRGVGAGASRPSRMRCSVTNA